MINEWMNGYDDDRRHPGIALKIKIAVNALAEYCGCLKCFYPFHQQLIYFTPSVMYVIRRE